ncbi:MAG TPA: aldehyde oxidase, partial [Pseudomonadota bacterium]|nr:aldehyde oxidase [Pseudomonadota bacterium]
MSHRPLHIIGKPRRRVDGRAKVSGETRYADDISLPRMLHCRLLRSPLPHARIVSIDASRALSQPGVHLVLTGQDMPTTFGILPVSQDEHALCLHKVRFVGDPVAAVVASSELVAEEALSLIDVQYEPLPTIASPEEALATEDPRIHEYGDQGNIHKAVAMSFGSVDDGFAQADHIFEDTFHY